MTDTILKVGDNTSNVEQLTAKKQNVDILLQKLVSHLTVIDSTVIGLLTALCDTHQQPLQKETLLAVGASLLFLSLVAGIYCMCRYYITMLKIYCALEGESKKDRPNYGSHEISYGRYFVHAAIFCPVGLCVGLLSLLVSLFL